MIENVTSWRLMTATIAVRFYFAPAEQSRCFVANSILLSGSSLSTSHTPVLNLDFTEATQTASSQSSHREITQINKLIKRWETKTQARQVWKDVGTFDNLLSLFLLATSFPLFISQKHVFSSSPRCLSSLPQASTALYSLLVGQDGCESPRQWHEGDIYHLERLCAINTVGGLPVGKWRGGGKKDGGSFHFWRYAFISYYKWWQ